MKRFVAVLNIPSLKNRATLRILLRKEDEKVWKSPSPAKIDTLHQT